MKKPLRVEDDGCYVRIVDAKGEHILVMTGRPDRYAEIVANAEEIVKAMTYSFLKGRSSVRKRARTS